MAHRGLALATSIATIIATLLLYNELKKKIGSLGTKRYVECGLKSLAASLVMGLVACLVYNSIYRAIGGSFILDLVSLLVAIGCAVLAYLLLIYLFKIKEVIMIAERIKQKRSVKYSD